MVFCCSKCTKTVGNLVKVPSKYIELGGYLIFKKGKSVYATCLVEIKAEIEKKVILFKLYF
jgi:hypothetical protein